MDIVQYIQYNIVVPQLALLIFRFENGRKKEEKIICYNNIAQKDIFSCFLLNKLIYLETKSIAIPSTISSLQASSTTHPTPLILSPSLSLSPAGSRWLLSSPGGRLKLLRDSNIEGTTG